MNSVPRSARIHYPGAIYHVMARGVDGRTVFVDDNDRQNFLQTVLSVKNDARFSVLAYCLMDNHFHFAIKVGAMPLSAVMHRLLTSYVVKFNARHERTGHLFQARYKSVLCLDDAYLIALVRYIHQNPVRAGLVMDPSAWPWSSHRAYLGRTGTALTDVNHFLEAFGSAGLDADRYERWAAQTNEGFSPWPEADSSLDMSREEEVEVIPLDALAASMFPDDAVELRSESRNRSIVWKRFIFAERAFQSGHSQTSIAEWIGCSPSGVHRLLRRNKSKSQSLTPAFSA
ncbi:MAG TPA: transposase [Elusimicrobiota bacterium]|nr:transposase [Elusimicrobiota bacterium]